MKMPELRPIPYIPNSKEAEEQTIREYALAYGEMVREPCVVVRKPNFQRCRSGANMTRAAARRTGRSRRIVTDAAAWKADTHGGLIKPLGADSLSR